MPRRNQLQQRRQVRKVRARRLRRRDLRVQEIPEFITDPPDPNVSFVIWKSLGDGATCRAGGSNG